MSQDLTTWKCARRPAPGSRPAGDSRGDAVSTSFAALAACLTLAAAAAGCGAPEAPPPPALHLVDLYEPAFVS